MLFLRKLHKWLGLIIGLQLVLVGSERRDVRVARS